ncbi:hypothetical protein DXG01_010828 [Tephrocybe rancida]|nr:hypothetical protein DXG01_010828 [Tephrocybe rancida]
MALLTQTFVVDDSDSHLNYTGNSGWHPAASNPIPENFGLPYNGTLKATAQTGDSLSFSFQGTSVSAFGITGFRANNTTHNVSQYPQVFECSIDDTIIGPTPQYTDPQPNIPLCESDILSDGLHLFQINTINNANIGFALDYLTFTSSNDPSGYVVKIENDSPSILKYDPSWVRQKFGSVEVMVTNTLNSQVTIDFMGTKLSWLGVMILPTVGSYTVDGGPSTFFAGAGRRSLMQGPLYNQVFFTTSELSPGSHSIVVSNQGLNPLALQYLYITPSSTMQSTPSASSVPTATSSSVSLISDPSDAGAIAGGVIGGIVIILLTIVALLLLVRKRRRSLTVEPLKPDMANAPPSPPRISRPRKARHARIPIVPSSSQSHDKISNGPSDSSTHGAYGYNEATIEQTRALRKGQEAALEAKRVTSRHDSAPRSPDALPTYNNRA